METRTKKSETTIQLRRSIRQSRALSEPETSGGLLLAVRSRLSPLHRPLRDLPGRKVRHSGTLNKETQMASKRDMEKMIERTALERRAKLREQRTKERRAADSAVSGAVITARVLVRKKICAALHSLGASIGKELAINFEHKDQNYAINVDAINYPAVARAMSNREDIEAKFNAAETELSDTIRDLLDAIRLDGQTDHVLNRVKEFIGFKPGWHGPGQGVTASPSTPNPKEGRKEPK